MLCILLDSHSIVIKITDSVIMKTQSRWHSELNWFHSRNFNSHVHTETNVVKRNNWWEEKETEGHKSLTCWNEIQAKMNGSKVWPLNHDLYHQSQFFYCFYCTSCQHHKKDLERDKVKYISPSMTLRRLGCTLLDRRHAYRITRELKSLEAANLSYFTNTNPQNVKKWN